MATTNGASSTTPPTEQLVFSATYQSDVSEPFSFSQTLPAPDAASVQQKTDYLSKLRHAVVDVQENINKELTARMDEDKARDASGRKIPDVDEAKEEENYGEEVVEEEEE